MKFFYAFLFLWCANAVHAQRFTNKGKEFWVGYGHNQLFTANTPNQQSMVLYLSADAAANVTVSVNGTTWTRTYAIPANSVTVSDFLPKTGTDDCRILAEGLSTKGIHIVSNVPIAAFVHTYGQYSSGGTMLLPVDTYSYSFFSVNSEQNATDSYSWFYVIASENNTKVRITPSRNTVNGGLQGIPFEVSLNKGQLYNVMGKMNGGNSLDLSGSKIQSIVGVDGTCHPVGVFSGSSRTFVCSGSDPLNSGSDFIMQQVFPNTAWGSKFITALTSKSTSPSQLNNNKFRAYVREPGTLVRKNGAVVSGLINNFYYDFLATSSDVITASKPILLAQFIPSANGCGTDGLGDPEMFCVSPVEQAIKSVTFFSSSRENITSNYLTLVIPTNGLTSLKIDGSFTFDYTYAHPNAPGYSVVVKKFPVPNLQHKASSDSAFTAITYGLGEFESYGYNAGTNIDNLEAIINIKNEYATNFTPYTCLKTPFHPVLKTIYKPSTITWYLSGISGLVPNADVTLTNPVPTDSTTESGRKYYLFQLPGNYMFNQIGSDTIKVSLTNLLIENCTYSINTYLVIDVKPAPTANFTVSAPLCLNDSVRFTDASPNPQLIKRWNWNFGDGTIDSVTNPVKAYALPGNYNIKLQIIKSDDGCVGDTIKPITINPSPIAAFTSPQNICMPNGNAIFTNLSTFPNGNASTLVYTWDFGDGANSSISNPSHIYAASGPFRVTLKATSVEGCIDTSIQVLSSFLSKPVAAFTLPQNICMPNGNAVFTNQSTLPNGSAASLAFDWNFGDGNHSNITDPTHIYTGSGPFTVVLKATSPQGCVDSVTKVLSSFIAKPVAAFALPQNVCMPNGNAAFINQSTSPNGNISSLTFDWNFGDGNHSIITDPLHVYTANGPFTVVLKATSLQGCVDSSIQVLSAFDSKPVVAFTLPQNVCMPGGNAVFTNQTTLPNGTVSSLVFDWNFGDGIHTNVTDPLHVYPSNGPFTIVLKAVSPQGCIDSSTQVLSAFIAKPVAAFTLPQNVCMPGGNAFFTNQSTLPNGAATSLIFDWNFGDGNHSSITDPTHSFSGSGPFTIVLKAISPQGCTDSSTQVLTSFIAKPIADFLLPQNICMPGGNAIFTNQSTFSSGSSASLIYDWAFGDGSHSNITDPSHMYQSNGPFTITLKAVSPQGCVDSITKELSSFSNKPIVAFTLPQTVCMPGGNAVFTNQSSLPNGSSASMVFDWNFGDGNHANVTDPVHVYPSNGPFTVVLKAVSPQGCVDSATKVMSAFSGKPTAAFDVPVKLCSNEPVILIDRSNPNIASWNWGSGSGSVSNKQVPQFIYTQAGTFTAYLVVANNGGCLSDTVRHTFTIFEKPQADAGPSFTTYKGVPVILQGSTSNPSFGVQWSPSAFLNNGNILMPTATPPASQTYLLSVTGQGNCVATDTMSVKVLQDIKIPNAFSPNGDGINDVWRVPFLADYPLATVQIFNRWGQVVYQQSGYPKPWDGKLKGQPLPIGAYYYIIDTKDGENSKYNGSVLLLR